jgi:sulfur carrier protein
MRYIAGMHLLVNGEPKDCAELTTLEQFIEQLGMQGDRVAVELNREIVPRARWLETLLRDGERLEIVHFVGGGTNYNSGLKRRWACGAKERNVFRSIVKPS